MSLLEKIKAKKAEEKLLGERPASQQISEKDISLRGTGLTKREAEKNTRAYERETKASLEKGNADDLVSRAEKDFTDGIAATIAEMREANNRGDIVLDNSQILALAGILHNQVGVMIGAAGTGKTTLEKRIIEELKKKINVVHLDDVLFVYARDPENRDAKPIRILLREAKANGMIIEGGIALNGNNTQEQPGVALAAYTGRATQQIRRAIPDEDLQRNISTIHSLLGYAPVYEDVTDIDPITGMEYEKAVRRFRPSFDSTMKLPYTIYIFDEASMIPIPLFNEVVDAIHDTSRILLIGDIHQLPPVYGKSVLGYAMRKWPVFELTTIHRQAAGNAIIANAHRTLQGKPLENASNFHIIGTGKSPSPSGQGELHAYFLQVIKQLSEMPINAKDETAGKRYDPFRDAIIVPQNKSMVGTDALNEKLVTMFNPEIRENGVIINKRINIHTGTGHSFFAVRDKVMITSNINTAEPPITNGMIGIIESINVNGRYDMKRAQVDFSSDDAEFGEEDISLDLENMSDIMTKALGSDEKEKDKNDDANDQRQSSHVLTIKFENGQTYSCSTAGDYRRITHGYAITCHKSQGGEYPNIVILCHSVNAVMLSQEWLYTAITRARNNVYIICNQRGLNQALSRQIIKGNTLAEKIKSYVIEVGADDEIGFDTQKYPILWNPKEL